MINLTTGLEDPEKVTVAYRVAVGAAETGRPAMMFLAKEAVRLGGRRDRCRCRLRRLPSTGRAGEAFRAGRRPILRLPDLLQCQRLDAGSLISGAERQGTVPLRQWIGDDAAASFSY